MSARVNSAMARLLVTGASSQIGRYLLPRLLESGHTVHAFSRAVNKADPGADPGIRWHLADLSAQTLPRVEAEVLLHLAPIWLLPPRLGDLMSSGVGRLIVFSSTSVLTKRASSNHYEAQLADTLWCAEQKIWEACQRLDLSCTIFRPTLIYGRGSDRNVTSIARFVHRFGFFPLPGSGRGLRQPVHADDLASACLSTLANAETFGRTYNLSGGSTLSYRYMVEKVFRALGREPRILSIPLGLYRTGLRLAALLPSLHHLTPNMAERAEMDLVFDCTAARHDFGYAPRPFEPDIGTFFPSQGGA